LWAKRVVVGKLLITCGQSRRAVHRLSMAYPQPLSAVLGAQRRVCPHFNIVLFCRQYAKTLIRSRLTQMS